MDNTTAETAQGQAEKSGDVPASQEGQLESRASIAPPQVAPETKPEAETKDAAKTPEAKPENEDAKKKRISDKDWQQTKEKAEKADSLQNRVEQLEKLSERKDWELDHPIVRDERYKEEWQKVNEDPRYSQLTFEERWKLISREDATSINRDLAQAASRDAASVPQSSRSAPQKKGIDPETEAMGKYWGNKPEDFEKYGLV